MALFCLAIGRDPRGMTVAVVNEDVGPSMVCLPGNQSYTDGCILGSKKELLGEDVFDFSDEHKRNLSCRFMAHLDPEVS